MKESLNYKYPLQVWLTSSFLGPLFLSILMIFKISKSDNFSQLVTIAVPLLAFGVLFSIPGVLITQAIFSQLAKFCKSNLSLRLFFCMVVIILACFTIYSFGIYIFPNSSIIISFCYAISILISGMIFKVEKSKTS
jgi:Kef-type K+ transport system membrane component KefB